MTRLTKDPALAKNLGMAGLEHCRKFSWARFVDGLDDRIDAVVASGGDAR